MGNDFDDWLTNSVIGVPTESFQGPVEGQALAGVAVAGEVAAGESGESGDDAGGGDGPKDQEKTDDSRLVPAAPAWVSPAGQNTDNPQPAPGTDYDFCVDVINQSTLPSGSFTVHFKLGGDQDPAWEKDSDEQDGLGRGASSTVCVHFGQFENKFAVYKLDVSVSPKSAPDQKKDANVHEFTVFSKSSSDSGGSDD